MLYKLYVNSTNTYTKVLPQVIYKGSNSDLPKMIHRYFSIFHIPMNFTVSGKKVSTTSDSRTY